MLALTLPRELRSDTMLKALGSHFAVIQFTVDGMVCEANGKFLALMGYSLAEIQGQHHRIFVDAAEAQTSDYEQFWRDLREGRPQSREFRRHTKDGRTVWLQACYAPVQDSRGRVTRVVKIAMDVTEQKKTQADCQSQLAAMAKTHALIEFSPDGTILTANEIFTGLMGYDLNEIEGKHHRMFVRDEESGTQAYSDFWQALARGEAQQAEFCRVAKDGQLVWLHASYNPVLDHDGQVAKVVKVATDITDSKQTASELAHQVTAVRRAMAVIEFEPDGTILGANDIFCSVTGYDPSSLPGQHHRIFMDPQEAADPAYQQFWQHLAQGNYHTGRYRRLTKTGDEIWIDASYNPIKDALGRTYKVMKFAMDVTKEVRRRQALGKEAVRVDDSLTQIVEAAAGTCERTKEAAAASERTSQNVQAVAATVDEFSAASTEISASVSRVSRTFDQVAEEAEGADQATSRMTQAAGEMNKVVDFIQDVASRINLLALNATIEAARAGEAGRGFSVVATEVKTLAKQVQGAIEQISAEVHGVQGVTRDVVERLGSIRDAVGQVHADISGVAGALEEQSASSQEIAANMQHAATAVADTDRNLDMIAETANRSDELARDGLVTYRDIKENYM